MRMRAGLLSGIFIFLTVIGCSKDTPKEATRDGAAPSVSAEKLAGIWLLKEKSFAGGKKSYPVPPASSTIYRFSATELERTDLTDSPRPPFANDSATLEIVGADIFVLPKISPPALPDDLSGERLSVMALDDHTLKIRTHATPAVDLVFAKISEADAAMLRKQAAKAVAARRGDAPPPVAFATAAPPREPETAVFLTGPLDPKIATIPVPVYVRGETHFSVRKEIKFRPGTKWGSPAYVTDFRPTEDGTSQDQCTLTVPARAIFRYHRFAPGTVSTIDAPDLVRTVEAGKDVFGLSFDLGGAGADLRCTLDNPQHRAAPVVGDLGKILGEYISLEQRNQIIDAFKPDSLDERESLIAKLPLDSRITFPAGLVLNADGSKLGLLFFAEDDQPVRFDLFGALDKNVPEKDYTLPNAATATVAAIKQTLSKYRVSTYEITLHGDEFQSLNIVLDDEIERRGLYFLDYGTFARALKGKNLTIDPPRAK